MSTIGEELKGFDNNYKFRGDQECPHVRKYGIWGCLNECPFPKKCWMEMLPHQRRQAARLNAKSLS